MSDYHFPNRRKNLIKLARYFNSRKKLQAEFDMGTYSEPSHLLGSNTCGSVGCALGHGPYAGILKLCNQSWHGYAKEFAPYDDFDFLFGSQWAKVDNSKVGVVRRICYYLEHGTPKSFFDDDVDLYEIKDLYADYNKIPTS